MHEQFQIRLLFAGGCLAINYHQTSNDDPKAAFNYMKATDMCMTMYFPFQKIDMYQHCDLNQHRNMEMSFKVQWI